MKDRIIPLEGVRNFRDFGGYASRHGGRVRRGRLFRSGHYAEATHDDLKHVRRLGIQLQADLRRPDERGDFGNRVSSWIVRLPLGESDPRKQVEAIRAATRDRKGSHEADAIEALTELMDWLPFDVQNAASRTTNCVVTNVRGPGQPLYLLSARQLAVYGHPPLLENHGLSIGVLSYDGTLCWGLIADADRVPDIALLARHIEQATARLAAAAGLAAREPKTGGAR